TCTTSGNAVLTPDTVDAGSHTRTPLTVSASTGRTPITIDTTDGTRPSTTASPSPNVESVGKLSNTRRRRRSNT
ncbi:hypothetical protein PFISCL1PPCAC_8863, partial [Pristionchus fissidentatus]